LLVTFLAITPRISLPPGLFFSAILADGALQAALGAWFQISVVALASVFGPDAIASYMTGGALVAVGVSVLKLVTAYSAIRHKYDRNQAFARAHARILANLVEDLDEGNAASDSIVYFSVAAASIVSGIAAYAYLYPKIPDDIIEADRPQLDRVESDFDNEPTEVDYLLGRVSTTPIPMSSTSIWIVARKNAYYNIAVFYVFVVTLVRIHCQANCLRPFAHYLCNRRSSQQSLPPSFRSAPRNNQLFLIH
jgi:equilibrative nucleoside transporter 1/2/3